VSPEPNPYSPRECFFCGKHIYCDRRFCPPCQDFQYKDKPSSKWNYIYHYGNGRWQWVEEPYSKGRGYAPLKPDCGCELCKETEKMIAERRKR